MIRWITRIIIPTILFGAVATIGITDSQLSISQTLPINENAKAVTVRIDGQKLGSGVIIDRQGSTYIVLTNWHVINIQGQYFVQTVDSQRHSIKKTTQLGNADLALVYFQSNSRYSIVTIGDSDLLVEGQKVHISGYPGRGQVARERTYRFYSDTLTGFLSPSDILNGYQLIFTDAALKGMSGSPIFDDYGQLVGIFGLSEGERGQQLSTYGIPINTAIRLANRERISIRWSKNDQIGKTRQELGQERYLAMVLKVKNNLSNRDTNAKLMFPAGVNRPIRLRTLPSQTEAKNYLVIGYFDHSNQTKPFTAKDLLELINESADLLADDELINSPFLLVNAFQKESPTKQNQKVIAQRQTKLVIDLLSYNPSDRKLYRLPNITITALCRDVLNAVLNNQLETHDYNLGELQLN